MTKEEFEAADLPDKKSNYTLLRRDAGRQAASRCRTTSNTRPNSNAPPPCCARPRSSAATRAFAEYLRMRADALLSDDFRPATWHGWR